MKSRSLGAALCAALALTSAAYAAPVKWAGNGHYYQFIDDNGPWTAAFAASALLAPLENGRYTPYLATITSAEEFAFVGSLLPSGPVGTWLGGSDFVEEGVWRWVAGPETGNIFFGPGAPVDAFHPWNAGEPSGGERFLSMYFIGADLIWNDSRNTTPYSYVVEWSATGGVPEPASWAMMIAGFGLVGAVMRRRALAIA